MINLENDQCPLYPGSSGIVIASLHPHSPHHHQLITKRSSSPLIFTFHI